MLLRQPGVAAGTMAHLARWQRRGFGVDDLPAAETGGQGPWSAVGTRRLLGARHRGRAAVGGRAKEPNGATRNGVSWARQGPFWCGWACDE